MSERGVATSSDKYQAMLSAQSRYPAETATAQSPSLTHPCILAPPSHLELTPKGVKENRALSKQGEGATVVGSQ